MAAVGLVRPSHRMATGQKSQSTPGGQVAGVARRPGTRERGYRVHWGSAGLVRPSHRMAAGGRDGQRSQITLGGQAAGE